MSLCVPSEPGSKQQGAGPHPAHLRRDLPRLEAGWRSAPEHLLQQRWLQGKAGAMKQAVMQR